MSEPVHHTISALVENKAGVLGRVANLFSRRGFNIFSLAVAPTEDLALSRITIVVDVESAPLDQVVRQLDKLVNVVAIRELDPRSSTERELLLATVGSTASDRSQVVELTQIFEGRILAVAGDQLTVSLEGHPAKVDDFEALLAPFGIAEIQRTGRVALPRLSPAQEATSARASVASGDRATASPGDAAAS